MITPKWDNRFRPPKKSQNGCKSLDEENVQHHGEARMSELSFGDSTLRTGCSSPRISIAHQGLSSGLSLPHHTEEARDDFVVFVPQGVACHPLRPLTRFYVDL